MAVGMTMTMMTMKMTKCSHYNLESKISTIDINCPDCIVFVCLMMNTDYNEEEDEEKTYVL